MLKCSILKNAGQFWHNSKTSKINIKYWYTVLSAKKFFHFNLLPFRIQEIAKNWPKLEKNLDKSINFGQICQKSIFQTRKSINWVKLSTERFEKIQNLGPKKNCIAKFYSCRWFQYRTARVFLILQLFKSPGSVCFSKTSFYQNFVFCFSFLYPIVPFFCVQCRFSPLYLFLRCNMLSYVTKYVSVFLQYFDFACMLICCFGLVAF